MKASSFVMQTVLKFSAEQRATVVKLHELVHTHTAHCLMCI